MRIVSIVCTLIVLLCLALGVSAQNAAPQLAPAPSRDDGLLLALILIAVALISAFGVIVRTALLAVRDAVPAPLFEGILKTIREVQSEFVSVMRERVQQTPNTFDDAAFEWIVEQINYLLDIVPNADDDETSAKDEQHDADADTRPMPPVGE